MSDTNLVMKLAKLVIAVAWADGELSNEEINTLKRLLFRVSDLTGDDWAHLNVYMASPVTESEREELMRSVLESVAGPSDKDLVMTTLTALVEADGKVTTEEAIALEEVKNALDEKGASVFARVGGLLTGAFKGADAWKKSGTWREERVEEFIKNTVYFQVLSNMKAKGIDLNIPEEHVRKLCLAAGLMAQVAGIDSHVSDEEKAGIRDILKETWGLPETEADVVAEISASEALRGLDHFRLTNGFNECTTRDERRTFLECLFRIAHASDGASLEETEEIRKISRSLKLDHKDFIDAKVRRKKGD
ncbi:TerB family tellurite resistance protein [Candidatus Hydrogenedentota bacterium]